MPLSFLFWTLLLSLFSSSLFLSSLLWLFTFLSSPLLLSPSLSSWSLWRVLSKKSSAAGPVGEVPGAGPCLLRFLLGATTFQVVSLSESMSASPSCMLLLLFGAVGMVVGGEGAFFTFFPRMSPSALSQL